MLASDGCSAWTQKCEGNTHALVMEGQASFVALSLHGKGIIALIVWRVVYQKVVGPERQPIRRVSLHSNSAGSAGRLADPQEIGAGPPTSRETLLK